MPFPTCEDGYNRRKLTDFAKGVVDDFKGIGKFLNPPHVSPYYVPPYLTDWLGAHNINQSVLYVCSYPIIIPITICGCGFYVTNSPTFDAEVCLYDSTDDGYPNHLLGHKLLTGISNGHIIANWDPIDLEPGLYWVGIVNYAYQGQVPSLTSYSTLLISREFTPEPDFSSGYPNGYPVGIYRVELSQNQLPNPFPPDAEGERTSEVFVFLRTSQG
jgi:hypothetical protein